MSRKQNSEHPCDVTEQTAVNVISLTEAIIKAETQETCDYDYKREKSPARSTYLTHLRELSKRIIQTATTVPVYNSFDRIKMCIDLRVYGEVIGFKIIDMMCRGKLGEPKTFLEQKMENQRKLHVASRKPVNNLLSLLNTSTITDEDIDEIANNMIIQEYTEQDDTVTTDSVTRLPAPEQESEPEEDFLPDDFEDEEEPLPEHIGKNFYPNCWIEQQKLPLGLNAFYIKDDLLIMDITGKFMASNGFLGLISVNNIAQCLRKIRDLHHVYFDVAKAIEIITVRLCDVTLDIKTHKQGDYVRAVSSIYPFYSANNTIKKYGNTSILIKSKADKVKKSFIIYNKGKEVRYERGKYLEYWMEIGNDGLLVADNTLRLEAHLFTFDSMRKYLQLPDGEIKLTDLLKSKAPVMLNILKDYNITEEKLRDKIKAHVEVYLPTVENTKDLTNILAAERIAELQACQRVVQLLEHQQYEFPALIDMVALENGLTDNEALMNELSPFLKHSCYTYLLHYKPKTIKLLLDLLNIIHTAYGRNSDLLMVA